MKTRIVEGITEITSDGEILYHTFDGGAEFNALNKNYWTAPNTYIGNYEEMNLPSPSLSKIMKPYFVLFFRSKNQGNGLFPKTSQKKIEEKTDSGTTIMTYDIIEADTEYNGNFGFDTRLPRLYKNNSAIINSYTQNPNISTTIAGKSLNNQTFKLENLGNNQYYIPSALIMKGKESSLYIKLFASKEESEEVLVSVNFKLVDLDIGGLPKKSEDNIKYKNYSGNAVSIVAGHSLSINNNQITEGNIVIQANEDFDFNIGLICYYTNKENKEIILGQCNIIANKKLDINLKFIKVKVCNNDIEKYSESHPLNLNSLQNYLNNNSMNQAGIQVRIPNTTINVLKLEESYKEINQETKIEEIKFKLSDYTEIVNLKDKADLSIVFNRNSILALKNNEEASTKISSQMTRLFENMIKEKIINSPLFISIYEKYKTKYEYDNVSKEDMVYDLKNIYMQIFIPVYLLEDITCEIYKKEEKWKWTEAFELSAEGSHRKKIITSKFSLMKGEQSYSTYAHELAHALSVDHIFTSDLYQGETLENIMDYYKSIVDNKNKKMINNPQPNSFVKKQWEIMRNYHNTRTENETTKFDDLLSDKKLLKEFIKECTSLFDTL